MNPPEAYIVYCERRMLLDKGPYRSWMEIQDAYADYVASLEPATELEIVEFFREDFGPDESGWPFTRDAVAAFFRSADRVLDDAAGGRG